ncbi:diguanylate cyclase [Paenibacillus timonensis]|uniref:Diguanylate cyclase domain-containing protein n=1 Tax=Paenibacillus timonensis TaxID=225915 RepID=A0ABW3SAK9_9BACL|nr:diguanylate cyclase [Paenibacillus timonensis]MCH1639414.1 diguanylate cyclase [Paenibacillus timonensis]
MEIKGGGLDWNTVGIPTALAILASFSVLGIAAVIAKTSQTDRKTRALMLCGIASAMGVAVWAAHVAGMLLYANGGERDAMNVDLLAVYGVAAALLLVFLFSWLTLVADRRSLEQMAYRDALTGLPNRNEMNRFFDTCQMQETLGLLLLDLDHFKTVNDTLGHDMGDLLVQEVGIRLHPFVRGGQRVYRIGGDEFVMILESCTRDRAERMAEALLRTLQQKILLGEREFLVTGSIGIRLGTPGDSDRSILLKTADQAMYQAKKLGKNRYFIYGDDAELALERAERNTPAC